MEGRTGMDGSRAAHTAQIATSARAFPQCSHLCVEILLDGLEDAPFPSNGDVCEIHYACLVAETGGCVDSSRSRAFSDRSPFVLQLGERQVVCGVEGVSA